MTNQEHGTWRRKVITASTETTLGILRDAHLLDDFYLAGRTGIALKFGHRLSLDLDFFSKEQFAEEMFLQAGHNSASIAGTGSAAERQA